MRIAIPLILLLAGVGTLITVGVLQGGIPEKSVSELLATSEGVADTSSIRQRIHGKIHEIRSEARPIQFVMRDKHKPELLITVEVDDVRPDLFKVDNDVAVEGFFDSKSKNLKGDRIFTKCPSKYEASDEVYEPGAPSNTTDTTANNETARAK